MSKENPTIAEAAAHFLATLSALEKQESQQELNKFVRWCGAGRLVSELTIHEVENYGARVGESLANPMKKLEPVKAFLAYAKKEGLIGTNLGIHLRVRKSSPKRGLPARGRPQQAISLTPQGYAELEAKLSGLKQERPRIAEELRLAAADKDFRENAPLEAARERQGQLEARIRELEATFKSAVILREEQKAAVKARLGSMVILRDLSSDEQLRYTLVSPSEVNPAKGKISTASPMGKALLGQAKGDVVEVAAPSGTLVYQIEEISLRDF